MLERLEGVEKRYLELEQQLADPNVVSDREAYQKLVKEHSDLDKVVTVYRDYKKAVEELEEAKELSRDSDPDMKALAREEISRLEPLVPELSDKLKVLLLPKDKNDEKDVVLEIRAGTGGEEAALFAADLFRMYSRFCEENRFKVEILTVHETGDGGLKEVVASLSGSGAYRTFKYESGTHRVQRVPETEAQGRIHTSAVTVAVLPEAEEVDITIDPSELRIDLYRSTGAGGQHVNTTDSAVRLTHLPTGLVITCQDERSQHKNRAKAMKVLRARLYDLMMQKQTEEIAQERKTQVGTGDRSERIRTYNFPQNRVTDHRIGLTLYRLDSVMEGQLQELIDALTTHYQAEALKAGS